MGGIAIGPSLLGQNDTFTNEYLNSPKGTLMISMFRAMAFMFLLFLLSLRVDISIIRRCGKLAIVIGIASLIVPLIVTTFCANIIRDYFKHQTDLYDLPSVAVLVSTTSFHVILVVLTDLKLLNSELGRLALSSSMISGLSSWVFLACIFEIKESSIDGLIRSGLVISQVSKILMVLMIVFVLRPIMFWMVKRTPDGKPLKEPFILSICLMVLICSFLGECMGQHFYFAPVILGMATPDGPPVVSSLMEKLECFVEVFLVPCYVLDAGKRTNIYNMTPSRFGILEMTMIIASVARLFSVIIPAVYYKLPLRDALALGCILNCKGLFDVQLFSRANRVDFISNDSYAMLNISCALHCAVLTWLAKIIYDPSRRYVSYTRRTIQHSMERCTELKILTCIYQPDNVPSTIGILEDSNPTKDDPIGVYVMNLKPSVGGTVPILMSHQLGNSPLTDYRFNEIDHIINAFYQIEYRHEGLAMVQCHTSYAPYPTLHDAVCSMAQGKAISLIVIPYRVTDDPSVRIVTRNIIQYAPCSVGVLYDNEKVGGSVVAARAIKRVGLIFLGGPDDRETLAFGARMAMHPHIILTVVRFVSKEHSDADLIEKRRDMNSINEFKVRTTNSSNAVRFVEYTVTQGSETARLLRGVCHNFQLILSGRRHDPYSSAVTGLSEWKEKDELGVIGDMLVSSDFNCKAQVFVIQQQASVVEQMISSPKQMSRRESAAGSEWLESSVSSRSS